MYNTITGTDQIIGKAKYLESKACVWNAHLIQVIYINNHSLNVSCTIIRDRMLKRK